MKLLLRLAWIGALVTAARLAPSVLITAPNIIHVDVPESVAVQVEEGSGNIVVEVYFANQLNAVTKCSTPEIFNLNSGNNYIEVKKLKVTAQHYRDCKIDDLKLEKYVQLVARSAVLGVKARMVPILLSTKRGYLFIQTDKPIYTPSQHVHLRVFTLDHMMRPAEESVMISVYNAQGLLVKKVEKFSASSILNDELQIPDIAAPGVWTITAKYSSAPESNYSTQFEVKKYVLPNFEVKILLTQPYFLVTEHEFPFNIEARYVYGKGVMGVAYVRFGIIDVDGNKMFLKETEQQFTLEDGKANVVLKRQKVNEALNQSQPQADLRGTTLYIAVTVLETATGALEEQELSTVKFVACPYRVDLSKTAPYFVPGGSLEVMMSVLHTDGSIAARVPVKLAVQMDGASVSIPESLKSDDSGVLSHPINTASGAKTLELLATVGDGENSETSRFTVRAYQSPGRNYLHISATSGVMVKPGQWISFKLRAITTSGTPIKYLYYMVLNKGQIIFLRRVERSEVTNIQFQVTGDMIPSFRLVAYYNLGGEIVANSAWLDVEDSCEGKLNVYTNVKDYLKPGSPMKLSIETDDKGLVAMAAVDSAVYVLNKKNKLTPNKVFKAMNAYDLGCTTGNGQDFIGVFRDAGLSFISSKSHSEIRAGYGCSTPPRRKKRASDFQTEVHKKVSKYDDPEAKRCCQNGIQLLPPRMKRSCQQRADRVSEAKCKKALLECCEFANEQRKIHRRATAGLGRTHTQEEEEDYDDEYDILTRTQFPESWLWKTWAVNQKRVETIYLPHSITKWEIQAISLSKGKGFCIAEPISVNVFQTFHIYLRLPYSVKRFEQMEIRPTLYNYASEDLQMRVFMDKTAGLCTPAAADESETTKVLVPANSAVTVPFAVVPMTKGNLQITVTALGPNGLGDKITKTLKMVREGVSKIEEKSFNLDTDNSNGKSLNIVGEEPSNLIPDGEVHISVRASADLSIEIVNNTLSADGVSRLIRVPLGCAEQTMIYMAPGVYAMNYLDETEQWTRLSPERRDEALGNMNSGLTRILQFRKGDGSYGAWLSTPSSTWLTAFVAKILSISREHISVDDETILTAVEFLMKHQDKTSGAFSDPAPVWHREMQGGVGGLEGDVSLTAFVAISLHHTLVAHPGEKKSRVRESIVKATRYLQQKLPTLTRPYTVAITAYALALVSDDSQVKKLAHETLMDFATESKDHRTLYWQAKDKERLLDEKKSNRVPSTSAIEVEATAFALMHMLLRDDIPTAKKIVTWLSEQKNYGGGFKSTQDTVVALEAFSKYWTKTFNTEGANILLVISSPGRSDTKKIHLDKSNNQVEEQLGFPLANNIHVDVKGKGKGTLTVLKLYNVMQLENTTCPQLKLEVDVDEDVQETEKEEDYTDDYDYGDEAQDEPFAKIHWQDLRRRRKREAGPGKQPEKDVLYQVCLWGEAQFNLSGMAIVDITMLSGFVPNLEDLNKLKDLSDRYIDHYEYQHGRLQIYFPRVPCARECITFKANQNVKVGSLQPAAATLYDYYEPDRKCTVFYNLRSKSRLISALCAKEVCQCAEGPCPQKKTTLKDADDTDARMSHACYSPRVRYGYKTKVLKSEEQNGFVLYDAQIIEILQRSKDERVKAGDIRRFIQRKACKMQLSSGKHYLLMGQDGETTDAEGQMQYMLESTSWVEELPEDGRCKATQNRMKCSQVQKFMDSYRTNGCNV